MNVHGVVLHTCRPTGATPVWPTNTRGYLEAGEVTPPLPPNGNPGIVPPWLLQAPEPQVIGLEPPDPNVPHIM